jgi:hypothetical protein
VFPFTDGPDQFDVHGITGFAAVMFIMHHVPLFFLHDFLIYRVLKNTLNTHRYGFIGLGGYHLAE